MSGCVVSQITRVLYDVVQFRQISVKEHQLKRKMNTSLYLLFEKRAVKRINIHVLQDVFNLYFVVVIVINIITARFFLLTTPATTTAMNANKPYNNNGMQCVWQLLQLHHPRHHSRRHLYHQQQHQQQQGQQYRHQHYIIYPL